MRLPDVEKAEISEAKIIGYLLSTSHRAGKSKAKFFIHFGFEPERWQELADALRRHASDNEVAVEEKTTFGTRYVVDGRMEAPNGRWLDVRSAWFIDEEGDVPRFITAHPLRRRRL